MLNRSRTDEQELIPTVYRIRFVSLPIVPKMDIGPWSHFHPAVARADFARGKPSDVLLLLCFAAKLIINCSTFANGTPGAQIPLENVSHTFRYAVHARGNLDRGGD
jgi:hypothetical protein